MSSFKELTTKAALAVAFFLAKEYIDRHQEPFQRGFFCSDQGIRYPFHSSTVSNNVLQTVSNVIPVLVIVSTEFYLWLTTSKERSKASLARSLVSVSLIFLFGSGATSFLTELSKYTIGRLRPNFMDVCQPDFGQIDCGSVMEPVYVDKYVCKGNSVLFGSEEEQLEQIKDSRLSFVSGHSSVAFQGMTFLILYLHLRLEDSRMGVSVSRLLVATIQVSCFAFAFFTAMSRVSDNKHNPSDVLAGSILGVGIQALNVKHILKPQLQENFEPEHSKSFFKDRSSYSSIDMKNGKGEQYLTV